MICCFQLALVVGKTWQPIALDAEPRAREEAEDEDEDEEEEEEGTTQPSGQKLISMKQVARHNTRDDCWVVIEVCPPLLLLILRSSLVGLISVGSRERYTTLRIS